MFLSVCTEKSQRIVIFLPQLLSKGGVYTICQQFAFYNADILTVVDIDHLWSLKLYIQKLSGPLFLIVAVSALGVYSIFRRISLVIAVSNL